MLDFSNLTIYIFIQYITMLMKETTIAWLGQNGFKQNKNAKDRARLIFHFG